MYTFATCCWSLNLKIAIIIINYNLLFERDAASSGWRLMRIWIQCDIESAVAEPAHQINDADQEVEASLGQSSVFADGFDVTANRQQCQWGCRGCDTVSEGVEHRTNPLFEDLARRHDSYSHL